VSPFDPEPYAQAIRRRNDEEELRLSGRRSAALAEAHRLAARIRGELPEVERVILFGSVAEDSVRSEDFDIDFAIQGGDVYRVEDIVADSAFDVDVADLARLPEHLKARIAERGIEL
jgi:predicted nucleotidyltransferase